MILSVFDYVLFRWDLFWLEFVRSSRYLQYSKRYPGKALLVWRIKDWHFPIDSEDGTSSIESTWRKHQSTLALPLPIFRFTNITLSDKTSGSPSNECWSHAPAVVQSENFPRKFSARRMAKATKGPPFYLTAINDNACDKHRLLRVIACYIITLNLTWYYASCKTAEFQWEGLHKICT